MARVNIPVIEADNRNVFSDEVATADLTTAIDAADGAEFEMSEKDDKYLILVSNSANEEKQLTVKAGNGIQGVCDLVQNIGAGKSCFVVLESGRFKNVTGADKGKVIFSGASDIKVAVFRQP